MFDSSLQRILDQLPFAYDDFDAANGAFSEWHASPNRQNKKHVDLWSYAFVLLYFTNKRTTGQIPSSADTEQAITLAFKRVQDNLDSVKHPSRFVGWVSVICKNTFLNVRRDSDDALSIEDMNLEVATAPDELTLDAVFVTRVVRRSIARMPPYLRRVAQLFLIEERSFQHISDVIGKSVATVRVYKKRVIDHLRNDPDVQQLNDFSP